MPTFMLNPGKIFTPGKSYSETFVQHAISSPGHMLISPALRRSPTSWPPTPCTSLFAATWCWELCAQKPALVPSLCPVKLRAPQLLASVLYSAPSQQPPGTGEN